MGRVWFELQSSCREREAQKNIAVISESFHLTFLIFCHFPNKANMRDTFLLISTHCTSLFMLLPSLNLGSMFEELHNDTFPLRSLAAHDCFWPQSAWNVSVPLENAVGAHPHGWVGSTWKCSVCLCQSVETSCLDQQRPAKASVLSNWFTQSPV